MAGDNNSNSNSFDSPRTSDWIAETPNSTAPRDNVYASTNHHIFSIPRGASPTTQGIGILSPKLNNNGNDFFDVLVSTPTPTSQQRQRNRVNNVEGNEGEGEHLPNQLGASEIDPWAERIVYLKMAYGEQRLVSAQDDEETLRCDILWAEDDGFRTLEYEFKMDLLGRRRPSSLKRSVVGGHVV
eukprot:PhM_4_TR7936/c0_g1_i1/m.97616